MQMTASRAPWFASRRSWWIRNGSPATSSNGLGTSRTSSPRRVPRPPARMHTGGRGAAPISASTPVQAAVAGDHSAQRVHVGFEVGTPLGQFRPRVPDGTQQLAGDAIAGRRAEEDRELGSLPQRYSAAALLLQRALVEGITNGLGASAEHLV